MECLREKNLAIADVETSGTHAASSRIIEIGILRIEDGKCVETYRSTVNPGKRVPVWITALTGITQEEVNTAPFFEEIIDHVERLTQDAIFVAHNVAFDYSFLEREFARHGRRFSAARLCTARLSRTLFPHLRRHSLSHIIERHGLMVRERHRAWDDAYALWQLLQLVGAHPHFNVVFESLIGKAPARLSCDDSGEAVIR
jgi:DNA polymerase III subunit epsilon